jgi:DNA-directed RNA polymerase subunit RPC12/RpoP
MAAWARLAAVFGARSIELSCGAYAQRGSMAQSNKTAGPACPYCGSRRVQRLRRRFVDRYIMSLLLVRPFHCIGCYRRFYSRARPPALGTNEMPEPISAAVAGRLALRSLSRPAFAQPQQPHSFQATGPIAVGAVGYDKRGFSRQGCEIPAHAELDGLERISGMVTDISMSGCFLRSLQQAPNGTELDLFLDTPEGPHSRSVVRRVAPAKGMALEFLFMNGPNFRRLRRIASGSVRSNPTQ